MKNKNRNRNTEPSIAPGIDDSEDPEQAATKDEIDKGEYTEVTTLSFD
ncbi:hypothetical protein [Bacillus salipaludis]|uniref:DUF4025 domain-containing protein n=1 Tax=Bacillus salipaludis TaxID=2547811 RepID=A0ABW8RJE5_9BACI